jgi:triacylglycerol esterase/lipase EstA (alpha/beta hydrolase family)
MHQVFLVPGFFGFSSIGRLKYFNGVGEIIGDEFERRGIPARVIEIDTLPTASIRRRAASLLEFVHSLSGDSEGPIHLVGHSTGGLDARLLVCPNADLQSQQKRALLARVASVVTVACPHFGTPLADVFGGALGKPALKLGALGLFYLLTYGRLPVGVGLRLARCVSRLDDVVGLKKTVADELFEKLLSDLGDEERRKLLDFLDGVGNDQSLLFQLTEAGCDLLNATTGKPEHLRYASVVTCGARPSVKTAWAQSFDVYAQSLHAVYGMLHWLASRADTSWYGTLPSDTAAGLARDLGRPAELRDNDGVVPTLSQIWGDYLGAVRADHLDVVGHFGYSEEGAGADWLPSGSGFGQSDFDALWRRVATYLVEGSSLSPTAPRKETPMEAPRPGDAMRAQVVAGRVARG